MQIYRVVFALLLNDFNALKEKQILVITFIPIWKKKKRERGENQASCKFGLYGFIITFFKLLSLNILIPISCSSFLVVIYLIGIKKHSIIF
jgi:hypothetical protein